jgi:hypothetical protein
MNLVIFQEYLPKLSMDCSLSINDNNKTSKWYSFKKISLDIALIIKINRNL